MATITVEIPDDIAERFESLDSLRRVLYEDFIIEQRQQGNLSLGEAAELLGVSYTEFFRLLGQKGLSFINAGPEETDKSFEGFHHKMEHSKE